MIFLFISTRYYGIVSFYLRILKRVDVWHTEGIMKILESIRASIEGCIQQMKEKLKKASRLRKRQRNPHGEPQPDPREEALEHLKELLEDDGMLKIETNETTGETTYFVTCVEKPSWNSKDEDVVARKWSIHISPDGVTINHEGDEDTFGPWILQTDNPKRDMVIVTHMIQNTRTDSTHDLTGIKVPIGASTIRDKVRQYYKEVLRHFPKNDEGKPDLSQATVYEFFPQSPDESREPSEHLANYIAENRESLQALSQEMGVNIDFTENEEAE